MPNDPLQAGPHYEKKLQVRPHEVGANRTIKLTNLLDYFQEAAGEHAEKLGASVTDLMARQVTWVLSRYHIKILYYPRWKQIFYLKTWPSARKSLFALREFEIRDEKNGLLAAATSSWMLLDIINKKPALLAEHLPDYPEYSKRAIADRFDPLPLIGKADVELPFRVRIHDLDWNRHVNHTVYIEWAVETAPREILENFQPTEIEVDFRSEARFGDALLSRTEVVSLGDRPVFYHQIVRERDQKELTRLRTSWKKT